MSDMIPHAGLTEADIEAYLAQRKADALKIDPANCDVLRSRVQMVDPYGLYHVSGEADCIGSHLFVRALPDGQWVSEWDLPDGILKEITRIKTGKEAAEEPGAGYELPF
jgi:hypothetical protein